MTSKEPLSFTSLLHLNNQTVTHASLPSSLSPPSPPIPHHYPSSCPDLHTFSQRTCSYTPLPLPHLIISHRQVTQGAEYLLFFLYSVKLFFVTFCSFTLHRSSERGVQGEGKVWREGRVLVWGEGVNEGKDGMKGFKWTPLYSPYFSHTCTSPSTTPTHGAF